MLFSKKRTHNSIYHKIYKQNYGLIPKEENGRSYEIHHIDGNHSNNDPKNLIAVTIQEHYNIHYTQCDWAACLMMSKRMNITPEEKSRLASFHCRKMMREGRNALILLDQSGINSPNYDHKVYCFEHTKTKKRVHMTRYEFYTKYNIKSHQLTGLIHGIHRSVHEWALITLNNDIEINSSMSSKRFRDQTIYSFRNIKTDEVVKMTSLEFRKKYNLDRGVVKRMIDDIKYNVNLLGWIIVK